MKVIGLINQKGGVAKTTTTSALAWGLANRGFKVLMVDFDSQGHLTTSVGIDADKQELQVYDWLLKKAPFKEVVVNLGENIDLMPTGIRLAVGEKELNTLVGKDLVLKNSISKIGKHYDYVFIDSSPSLGNLTINVLVASDEIIIPFKPELFSLEGITSLIDVVKSVEDAFEIKIKVKGFLATMFNSRTNSGKEIIKIAEGIAERNQTKVYKSTIRNSVVASDATLRHTNIYEYKPTHPVVQDYLGFVEEFIEDEKRGK